MPSLAPRLLLALPFLLVTSSCELMTGMEGVSVPRLAGQWQDPRGNAIDIKQGGFILEATMLSEAGKSVWTNASGMCADLTRFEMTFFRTGEKQDVLQAVVTSDEQKIGRSIKWPDGQSWTRTSEPVIEESNRPASQPHQKADPTIRED